MSPFGKLRRYLTIPSRNAARIAREVDDELRAHIAMRAESLEHAGMTPADALARAQREFGDLDDATHYCTNLDRRAERRRQAFGWLVDLWHDAAYSVRVLRRAPAFAIATVVTLALAVGASTAVYAVLHTYLIRPLPFPHADRLVAVGEAPSLGGRRGPSLREVDWTRVDSLFDATAKWDIDGFAISGKTHAENVTGAWVSQGFFVALGVRPAIGRVFRDDEYRDEVPVAIISHDLWTRHFAADSAVIGTTVTMHSTDHPDAALRVTIVGVLQRDFWPIQWRDSKLLRPLAPDRHWMPALARLAPGVSIADAERRLDAVVRPQLTETIDPNWRMTLTPALDRHSSRVRPLLVAVSGAVLFMLLAACGSVAGALVSRTAARRGELGLRLALGGSHGRIVRQLIAESAVLATLAAVLGVAIAFGLVSVGAPMIERQLGTVAPGGSSALRPTAAIMTLCAFVSVVLGGGLGLIPALTSVRSLKATGAERSTGSRASGARVRRILIAGQVTAATVLLFGAGLMFRTITQMNAIELGFRTSGVLRASLLLPNARYPDSVTKHQLIDRLLERVADVRGVSNVAAVYPTPFQGSWRLPVTAESAPAEPVAVADVFTISPGYFETMDVQLRAGRVFRSTDDRAAPLVVVISETLARRVVTGGSAIGRRIRVRVPYLASFDDHDEMPWRTVIGIVADTKKDFASTNPTDVYVPYAQNPRSFESIVVRVSGAEPAMAEPIKQAVASVDPDLALFDVASMTDVIANRGAQRRGLSVLLGAFAVFSLVVAALALYASLAYTVVQRRSELAIRVAIGASARSILRLVVAEGVVTGAVGLAVGVVLSLALGRVIENQLYGVGKADPVTLVSIAVVLTMATVAACAVPSMRAMRTDPALALRE